MQRRKFLKFGVGTLLAASLRRPSSANQRPNIVFILADCASLRQAVTFVKNCLTQLSQVQDRLRKKPLHRNLVTGCLLRPTPLLKRLEMSAIGLHTLANGI